MVNIAFVYAIAPDARIEERLYNQSMMKAEQLILKEPDSAAWPNNDRQDWIEDKAAELLHDFPADFWEDA